MAKAKALPAAGIKLSSAYLWLGSANGSITRKPGVEGKGTVTPGFLFLRLFSRWVTVPLPRTIFQISVRVSALRPSVLGLVETVQPYLSLLVLSFKEGRFLQETAWPFLRQSTTEILRSLTKFINLIFHHSGQSNLPSGALNIWSSL